MYVFIYLLSVWSVCILYSVDCVGIIRCYYTRAHLDYKITNKLEHFFQIQIVFCTNREGKTIYLTIYLSIHIYNYLYIYLYIYLSIYLSIYLWTHLKRWVWSALKSPILLATFGGRWIFNKNVQGVQKNNKNVQSVQKKYRAPVSAIRKNTSVQEFTKKRFYIFWVTLFKRGASS